MKSITTRQMGDACEMLVAAELTLAGIPTLKVPDNWPDYDLIAELPGGKLQKISVKSRKFKKGAHYLHYHVGDKFDWLAVVILPESGDERPRFYIVPRDVADERHRNSENTGKVPFHQNPVDRMDRLFRDYKDNFTLNQSGTQPAQ